MTDDNGVERQGLGTTITGPSDIPPREARQLIEADDRTEDGDSA